MECIDREKRPKPSLCRHSIRSYGLNRFLERIRSWSSSNSALHCQECEKDDMGKSSKKMTEVIFRLKFLWECLDCSGIFCGGETPGQPDGHIRCHAIGNRHLFAIPIVAWCFDCKSIQQITAMEMSWDWDSAIEVKEELGGMEQGDFDNLPGGYVVRSMQNLGNTCFFNAILQNLLSMDVLRANFAKLQCQNCSITRDLGTLFLETSDFLDEGKALTSHAYLLTSICLRVPSFWGRQEQDSHELLRLLLSELLREGTSFIEDIFGGKLSSTVSCVQCGNSSRSYEAFLDLSLAIPSSECSTKKDKVVTPKDLVPPEIEISSCPKGSSSLWEQYLLEGMHIELSGLKSSDLSSQSLTVRAANWYTEHHGFSRKKVSAKVDKEDQNESLTDFDTRVSTGEDVKSVSASKKRICPFMNSNLDLSLAIPSSECSIKKDKVGTPKDLVPPAIEFSSCPSKGSSSLSKQYLLEGMPNVLSSLESLNLSSQFSRVELNVYSRKRPRYASSLKFEGQAQSGNNSGDPLSIEKCLDLLIAPEILCDEYACGRCSNLSQDRPQNELQGGLEVMDEVKLEVESKDEGVDIRSRKVKLKASKRYAIFNAPRVLTIHLKRFARDTNGIIKKINSLVNIQEMLDLTPYTDPSCQDKEKPLYCLIGVVEHLGANLMGGHYVAYVRGSRSQGRELAWFRSSDLDVREVSLNEVLNSKAYILFYERR